jgi:hypothetical protein
MNRESGENINLGHDIIKTEPKSHQSIEQKDSFEKNASFNGLVRLKT